MGPLICRVFVCPGVSKRLPPTLVRSLMLDLSKLTNFIAQYRFDWQELRQLRAASK
uniref:Uncharacterized protein n=1 Tax=mine drainage metagenome TaxID=410659 RepID=E6PHU6_9ZZZZ